MKPVLHSGLLIKWEDDRGFGFIKPNDNGKEVFLHISALKKNKLPSTSWRYDFI
jgi:cold shock CspA family protein